MLKEIIVRERGRFGDRLALIDALGMADGDPFLGVCNRCEQYLSWLRRKISAVRELPRDADVHANLCELCHVPFLSEKQTGAIAQRDCPGPGWCDSANRLRRGVLVILEGVGVDGAAVSAGERDETDLPDFRVALFEAQEGDRHYVANDVLAEVAE